MAKNEEITGEFGYERNIFGKAENRTVIAELDDRTTVKGKAEEGALESGLTYRFYGHWTEHPKYGRQFAFTSFVLAQPAGMDGTIKYLQRGPGIGRVKARKIWEAWGAEALVVVRTNPEGVANEIPGITQEMAVEAAAYFERLAGIENITIALTELLGGRGFPKRITEELIKEYGSRAAEVVKENPYVLMRFKGCGFLRADRLYLDLGKPADAIERQARCAWYALHSDTEGSTWFGEAVCVVAIRKDVAGVNLDPAAAIAWAVAEGLISVRVEDGKKWLAERVKAEAEARLANAVHAAESEG